MRPFFLLFSVFAITTNLWAQAPQKMSYQAVIRNTSGELVRDQQVGMRISIIQESVNGTSVFVETHNPTTNANGLVSVEIGSGTLTNGGMESIDWTEGPFFLKTETDPTGGNNYSIVGTSQLLSVPFALHARSAEGLTTEIEETDPVFAAWDKSEGIVITEGQISDLKAYLTEEVDPLFAAWDKSEGIVITENQISDLKDYITSVSGESLGDLRDVDLAELETGMVISYNEEQEKWVAVRMESFYIEVDPFFSASVASNITANDINLWNSKQDALRGAERGEVLFFTGGSWYSLPPGQHGQTLTFCNGVPHWGPCPQGEMFSLTLEANENQGTLFGQGTYPVNTRVYIDWDSENSNYIFEKWIDQSGLIGWASNENTDNPVSFNMPDQNVTIIAHSDPPPPDYVYYGVSDSNSSGQNLALLTQGTWRVDSAVLTAALFQFVIMAVPKSLYDQSSIQHGTSQLTAGMTKQGTQELHDRTYNVYASAPRSASLTNRTVYFYY